MTFHIVALLLALADGRQRVVLGDHASVHHCRSKVEERDKHKYYDHNQIGEEFFEIGRYFHRHSFIVFC